jgi:PAS domain S-box-containing protein
MHSRKGRSTIRRHARGPRGTEPRPGSSDTTITPVADLSLDHNGIVVWEADAATLAVSHLSHHAAERAGLAPMAAGLVTDLVHPDDRERVVQVCRAVATDHVQRALDHRMPDSGGEAVLVRHVIAPSSGSATPVHRLHGVMIDVTDLVRAAEERRRLAAVIEETSDLVGIADITGHDIYLNPAGRRLLGIEESEDISALQAREHFATWAQAIVASEALAEAVRRGVWHGESALRTRDAREIPVSQVIVAPHGATGEIEFIATIARDITDEQQARAKTATLLEIARDVTGSLDMPSILERVHQKTASLVPCDAMATFYWQPDHTAFRIVAHHGLPADLADEAEGMEFSREHPLAERVAQGTTLIVTDPGAPGPVPAELLHRFRVQTLVAAPLAVRGRVLGSLVALRLHTADPFDAAQIDLVENIARQLALATEGIALYRAQQEEMHVAAALAHVGREMISSVDAPVLVDRLCQISTEILDAEVSQTVLWRNDDEEFVPVAAFGYPPEQLEAFRLLRFSRQQIDDVLRSLAASGVHHGLVAELEHPSIRELLQAVGMHAFLVMALRRGPEIIGMHSVCRRTTRAFTAPQLRIAEGIVQIASMALEHARLVEELERANRHKSDFVATMSHELRTPLNAVVGYIDLMLDGAFGPLAPAMADPVRRVNASARQLVELVNTTLDMSRIDSGRLSLDVREVDVRVLVNEIHSEMGELLKKAGVEFRWDVPTRLPRLRTDPLKLKLVLKNLVGNAMKFTTEGSVVVSVRRADGALEFAVRDTGIGIPLGAHELIFEAFRQADASPSRRYGGVGLGLYIVRRLVSLLGGQVLLESEVGTGSTFRVTLPLES